MVARPPLALFLVLAAGLVGCGEPDDPLVDWSGTVDTLATGTVVVRNPAEGLRTEAEAWTLEEELRVGTLLEEGPELFGTVGDIVTDERGRILVLESQADEVRLFDADGAYVRTIGRKGEGPGELRAAQQLLWGPRPPALGVGQHRPAVYGLRHDGRLRRGPPGRPGSIHRRTPRLRGRRDARCAQLRRGGRGR